MKSDPSLSRSGHAAPDRKAGRSTRRTEGTGAAPVRKSWSFTIEAPLRGHVCSPNRAFHPNQREFRRRVRLLANCAGVPDYIPLDCRAFIRVSISWPGDARLDAEDVGKLILDSIFLPPPRGRGPSHIKGIGKLMGDRRVLQVEYVGYENDGREAAAVAIGIDRVLERG